MLEVVEESDLGLSSLARLSPPRTPRTNSFPPKYVAEPNEPVPNRNSGSREAIDPDNLGLMREWITGFALVEFDLDIGPDLKELYPPLEIPLSVKQNIAFSSLPEGQAEIPKTGYVYSWRIPVERGFGYGTCGEGGDGALHGFVYFYQEQSEHLRRGYSQRSIVLLTHHPSFPGLFSTIISILGNLYFRKSTFDPNDPTHPSIPSFGAIETAVRNICNWPPVTEGRVELAFMGQVKTFDIPYRGQGQFKSNIDSIPASLPLVPLSSTFLSTQLTFYKILLLWELVLFGDPILVFSDDVRVGSELVEAVRGFIRPILFRGDWRPYFHIHEYDFKLLMSGSAPKMGTIVSTTNPIMLQSSKLWPNILRATLVKPGLVTDRKRHVRKNEAVEKAVEAAFLKGDYAGCDSLIFQHLNLLTEQFLAPLNRYFGTLGGQETSLNQPSASRIFQPQAFLATLKVHGTSLGLRVSPSTNQSSTEKFYSKFLKSPNFTSWLTRRMADVDEEMHRRYVDRLVGVDLDQWSVGRDGEEVAELAGRITEQVKIHEQLDVENAIKLARAPSPISLRVTGCGSRPSTPSRSPERNKSVLLRRQMDRLNRIRDSKVVDDEDNVSVMSGVSSTGPKSPRLAFT